MNIFTSPEYLSSEPTNQELFFTSKRLYEHFSKIIEQKPEKFEQQTPLKQSLDIQKTTKTILQYKTIINSLKEELEQIKKENICLIEKIKKLENQNNILCEIKKDTFNIRELFTTLKKDLSELNNSYKKQELTTLDSPKQVKQNKKPFIIKELKHNIEINNIHSNNLNVIIELSNKNIASCSDDGSISIISIDYNTKTWKQIIKEPKAHSGGVTHVCEIKPNKIVSCSSDNTIKIWEINTNNLSLIKTLTSHTNTIYQVCCLTNNRFASCSSDHSIKIWNSESPYNEITTLKHNSSVFNCMQMTNKEILISSVWEKSTDFWDLNNYTKINSIQNVYVGSCHKRMIELYDGNIAMVSSLSGFPIVVIDSSNYTKIKEIKESKDYSTISNFDNYSFLYVFDGTFVQISIGNYEIIYKNTKENKLRGRGGILAVEDSKYLLIENKSSGITVIEPTF